MTHYCGISAINEPFDIGKDETKQRTQWVFSVLATKRPSDKVVQEFINILVSAGIGTENVNIFGSSNAIIPEGEGPFLMMVVTGSASPLGTHNDGASAYRRPTVRVTVTGRSTVLAEKMSHAAYLALTGVRAREIA